MNNLRTRANTMEHRHGARMGKEFYTQVCVDGKGCRDAVTLDVSKHGLFVALSHPGLVANAIVNVVLRAGVATAWRTRAMVVHASDKGAGLLLEKDLPAAFYNVRAGKVESATSVA